ncbi:MAG TPA: SDR family NAD(P)-dependent oxidoreductase, partial [Reyranella sp.]|nr:SDR family NAD(P)-dependent oxidoreductase [Reyranella sp.]
MSGELSGRVAIVTGGASGIGAATAALLAGQGARVVVADLQKAKDGPGRFVHHDVASEESWKSLLA